MSVARNLVVDQERKEILRRIADDYELIAKITEGRLRAHPTSPATAP